MISPASCSTKQGLRISNGEGQYKGGPDWNPHPKPFTSLSLPSEDFDSMSPWRLEWAVVLLGSQLGISKHQSLSHRDLGWAMPAVGRAAQQCKGRLFFSICLHHVLSLVKIMPVSANHLRITIPIRPSNERHFHFPRRIDADISSPLQIRPTWSPHVPLVRTKTVRLRYDRAISSCRQLRPIHSLDIISSLTLLRLTRSCLSWSRILKKKEAK